MLAPPTADRSPRRPRPPAGILVSASLASLFTGLCGLGVVAAGWPRATVAAALAGAVAAAGTALLRAPSLPRPVRLLGPVAVSGAALVLATLHGAAAAASGDPPPAAGTVVLRYLMAAGTGLLGDDSWAFTVQLTAVLVLGGAWCAAWATAGRGSAAVAPGFVLLAVAVVDGPSPAAATPAATLAAAGGIGLIASASLAQLGTRWERERLPALAMTRSRYAAAATVTVVLVSVAALAAPPLTSADISGRVLAFLTGSTGSAGGRAGGPAHIRFAVEVVPGGALVADPVPVLTYATESGQPQYLRLVTETRFLRGTWSPGIVWPTPHALVHAGPGPLPRDRDPGDGGVGTARRTVVASVTETVDESRDGLVPFPGEPDAMSEAGLVSGAVRRPARVGGPLLTVDAVRADHPLPGRRLKLAGTVSTATAEQLRGAGTAYPAFLDYVYTALPDDETLGLETLRSLAVSWTASTTNPYDAAAAIERRLRDPRTFRYTLTPPSPLGSAWPVVDFLTRTHAGYCQYFASAMGALLRSVGIPTRLVSGYGPGTALAAAGTGTAAILHQVTSADAHTWVEVYFPTYGWIPFEPTPPSPQGIYEPFARGAAAAPPTAALPPAPSRVPPPPREAAPASAPVPAAGTPAVGAPVALGLAAGALAVVGIGAALGSAWFLRPRTLRGVWRRVGLAGRLVGLERDPAWTLTEYAQTVAVALAGQARPASGGAGGASLPRRPREALEELARISTASLFSGAAPHPRDLVRMRRAWRRLARQLPQLCMRRLGHAVTR